MDCKQIFADIYDYIHRLETDNYTLKKNLEDITRENTRLKDNEKDMFKVSTIITTSNENAKLKSYISILERQLGKYKEEQQRVVVYEDDSLQQQQSEEEETNTKEQLVVDDEQPELVLPTTIPSEEEQQEEPPKQEVKEAINEAMVFKVFRYKDNVYLMDEEKNIYENIDGEAGDSVGRRKLNTKTGKWKTILF